MQTLINKIRPLALALQKEKIYLTGSLALWLQGIDLGRVAHDIDFVTLSSLGVEEYLTLLGSIGIPEEDCDIKEAQRYEEDTYLTGWNLGEIFCELRSGGDIDLVEVDGLQLQSYTQILDKKFEYSAPSSSTRQKHIDDLEKLGFKVEDYLEIKKKLREAEEASHRVKWERIHTTSVYTGQQHNFKVTVLRSMGQLRPYADSVSHHEIVSSLPIEEVEVVARLKIPTFTNVTNKGWDFRGACSFPFGLDSYYSLSKREKTVDTFDLRICRPYTG